MRCLDTNIYISSFPLTIEGCGIVEDRIFKNRFALSPEYVPEKLIGRDEEIRRVNLCLSPALHNDRPMNAFIYGKTGSGKTAVAKYVLRNLELEAEKSDAKVKTIYVNCNQLNTTISVLRRICNVVNPSIEIPATGLPTSEYYSRLWRILDCFGGVAVIVLDEIDKLRNQELLYNLSRARENMDIKKSLIGLVCISNSLNYKELLDPRIVSSLNNIELIFPPYNAKQLEEILLDRAKIGLREGALGEGVIQLCAALAAREHGDARKAIMLLSYACSIASEKGKELVEEEDVKEANEKLEIDKIDEIIKTLPFHSKIILQTTLSLNITLKRHILSSEIYEEYKHICGKIGIESLKYSRFSEIISELDMLGLIQTVKLSRGRYGLTRKIIPNIPPEKYITKI
jgi:cell division control protein 6